MLTGRSTRDDHGAVLVEAAFVLPVLFMLIFGMVTFGFTLSQRNALDNAVREASRYGATQPVTSSVADWLDDVGDALVAASTGDMDPGTADRYICVALVGTETDGRMEIVGDASPVYDSSGECPGATCPTSAPCVQVVAERSAELNAVVYEHTVTLDSLGVSTFERT